VSRATSVGSVNLLSLKSMRSNDKQRSIPARVVSRLERRFSVVMAGKGFRPRECRLSIIQLERFSARRQVKVAKLSGISVKRFADKSSDCNVLASGARLVAEMLVRALSAKLKCLKNLHLVDGNHPKDRRLEVLPRGVVDRTLDPELPDARRTVGTLLRLTWPVTCRELGGLVGDVLR
jgi:hypothetical protein